MKLVILAGGYGSRLSEETTIKPKPMVEIGGFPIIWHIMKGYSQCGINDFIICLGYKGNIIKEYFLQYYTNTSDLTINLEHNEIIVHKKRSEPWRITLVDTGVNSMTGGRLKRVMPYLGDEPFCCTYGDGLANVNIRNVIKFHRSHGKTATITGVLPPSRFGNLDIVGDEVVKFVEKPKGESAYISGGFFVFSREVESQLIDDSSILEQGVLPSLAAEGHVNVFKHNGFWQPMDTIRDRNYLEDLLHSGKAEWKTWD